VLSIPQTIRGCCEDKKRFGFAKKRTAPRNGVRRYFDCRMKVIREMELRSADMSGPAVGTNQIQVNL